MISWTIFTPILVWTSINVWSKGKYLPSVSFMFLGLLCAVFSIYSTICLLRSSPRFILDDKGILCQGVFGQSKILWYQITSYRINRLAGAFVLIDLYLDDKPFFGKYKRIDASGLSPNYIELCNSIDSYLRIEFTNRSP